MRGNFLTLVCKCVVTFLLLFPSVFINFIMVIVKIILVMINQTTRWVRIIAQSYQINLKKKIA